MKATKLWVNLSILIKPSFMNRIIILITLLLVVFSSCKKNSESLETSRPEDPYKGEFITCNCSEGTSKNEIAEYLKAEINGISVCADIKPNIQGDFANMLTYGTIIRNTGKTYYDNLAMIRNTKDGKFMMAIFLENTHAFTKQYPYELPRANPEVCEIGELQLMNYRQITNNMCNFCSDNKWHYYASFFENGLKLYVDKFENDIFEGHFSGVIRTGSGRTATVKNGSFRIKLTIVQKDIVIP